MSTPPSPNGPSTALLRLKDQIRKRDGYRCQDCGMTNEEHLQTFGGILEVHRLLPGVPYDSSNSVTLCQRCHGKKPKTVERTFFADERRVGVWFLAINLYDPDGRRVFEALRAEAERKGVAAEDLAGQILLRHVEGWSPDYCI